LWGLVHAASTELVSSAILLAAGMPGGQQAGQPGEVVA